MVWAAAATFFPQTNPNLPVVVPVGRGKATVLHHLSPVVTYPLNGVCNDLHDHPSRSKVLWRTVGHGGETAWVGRASGCTTVGAAVGVGKTRLAWNRQKGGRRSIPVVEGRMGTSLPA
jgi:hypothetical protein